MQINHLVWILYSSKSPDEIRMAKEQMFVGKSGFLIFFLISIICLLKKKTLHPNHIWPLLFWQSLYWICYICAVAACNYSHTNRVVQFQLFLLFVSRNERQFEQLKFCLCIFSIFFFPICLKILSFETIFFQ